MTGKVPIKGPRLNEQVCYALYSTSRAITKAYTPLLSSLKLTYPQYVVMMALWENDNSMISQLANLTGIGNATLSPLLKRLESTGYIERLALEEDVRQKRIKLTGNGRALARKAKQASDKAFCATGLAENEALQLLSYCESIKNNLNGD